MTLLKATLIFSLILTNYANAKTPEKNEVLSYSLQMTEVASAWSFSQGSKEVVVAVIDTGADTSHSALQENLWTNPGETGLDSLGRNKAVNGVDDDGNGFIDDVHGWNFADNNNNLSDLHGHGTHVAGIVQSMAPKTNLMILKYYDPKASGQVNLANTVKALRYAQKMKVQIINYSGGGTTKFPEEEVAIRDLQKQGILFVAAAGNERSNSDLFGFYPADYGISNIISVTAIDENRQILPSSNYGRRSVDLAAPGKNIVSALPGGKYGTMTGTSQATAFVTGTAALLMAENPALRLDPEKIIQQLTNSGNNNDLLLGKTKQQTVLNSYRSMIMKDRGLDAFGSPTLTTTSLTDFSAKLNSDSTDPAEDEMPFKKIP